jgi:hypothetical protein
MSFTYSELTTAVKETLDVEETTFNDNLSVFVKNAEERIFKSVQLNVFRRNNTGNTSTGNKFLVTPPNFLSVFSLSVLVGGAHKFLDQKDVSFVQSMWPDPTETSVPRYYAQYDDTTFLLGPTPDAAYPAEIHYLYRPTSLVDVAAGTKTWLSDNAPDALLYGALTEGSIFLKAEEGLLARYDQRFVEALSRLKNLGEALQPMDQFRFGQLRAQRT